MVLSTASLRSRPDASPFPSSIISIVDRDRIWFKSHHGLDVEPIGRDPGHYCSSGDAGDLIYPRN
jgi:hypothetical protein